RPTLCLHVRSPGFEQRECREGFALGQVDARLTDREVVCPSHNTCLRDMALAKERQHPWAATSGSRNRKLCWRTNASASSRAAPALATSSWASLRRVRNTKHEATVSTLSIWRDRWIACCAWRWAASRSFHSKEIRASP